MREKNSENESVCALERKRVVMSVLVCVREREREREREGEGEIKTSLFPTPHAPVHSPAAAGVTQVQDERLFNVPLPPKISRKISSVQIIQLFEINLSFCKFKPLSTFSSHTSVI